MTTRNKHQVKNHTLPKRLAISAAVAATFLAGYGGRQAYAGSCTGAAGTYICTGAANPGTDVTQNLNSGINPLIVTTDVNFGISTSAGNAFFLSNLVGGTSINFTDNFTSPITGATRGIRALNFGTGATSITSTGAVAGSSGLGIDAYNSSSATNLIIDAAAVTGGSTGIRARNYGNGATSITSTGTVTGSGYYGIYARNSSIGTSLTIKSAAVTGGFTGIYARNLGTGATSITSTGAVAGSNGLGIDAYNSLSATNLTIDAAAVTGSGTGIRARNYGNGATSITSTGAVTGTNTNGIYAVNSNANSTSLTISTAAVSGGSIGIGAYNFGTGTTSITSTGTVTGTNIYGIYARNGSNASILTINSAAVMSGKTGIKTNNEGKGATSITTTGAVTGSSKYGIYAKNYSSATDLTIDTVAVTGGNTGIYARNYGKGVTSITSSGTITGTNFYGIYAYNSSSATSLTINTAAVTGGNTGISASNNGTGATSITSTGAVTGTNGLGINASNNTSSTDLTINSAAVTGLYTGINAHNYGTGTTSITVSGAVTGGKGAGIFNVATNASTITLNSGAAVSATSGNAIIDGAGNTNLIMNSGSSVTGNIKLGGGNDAIILAGGNFSAVTNFDGEAGNDRLSFAGSNGVFNQALMANIESVTIDSGSTMGLSFTGNAFNASGLTGGALIVQNGGILNATNGFALTGNLINSTGVVSMQNGSIDAPASISGNFTGGGQVLLDANFATNTADKLNIAGNILAGGTRVGVNDISTGPATGNAIKLVSVGGTTASGDFTLAAPVVNGAFNYNTLALVGQDWVLQSVAATPGGGSVFTPFAASFEALGQGLLTLAALPTLAARTQQYMGTANTSGANSGDETGIDSPIWLRINGGDRDIDSRRSTTGANFDTKHWNAQLGADFTVADTSQGRFIAGVYAGYGKADTDVKSTAGKSNIDTTAYSFGLTGTWYMPNAVYIDTQLQRSWYNTDLSAGGVGAGKVDGIDGDGYSASIELGKQIAINDSLNIIPQAQLVYAKVDADRFTGANAELVNLTDSKSLKARLGAVLTKRFTEDGATTGFVIANVIREFEDETQVNVSGTQLNNVVDRWSGELGLGLALAWSRDTIQYALSAKVTGATSLNNFGDSQAAQGEVNFRVKF